MGLDHILPPNSTCHPWSCPALASMQPKDIRIIDTRCNRRKTYHLPLNDLYGSSANEVTVYVDEYMSYPPHVRGLIDIEWPKGMKQLCLILCRHRGPWLTDVNKSEDDNTKWSFEIENRPLLNGSEFTLAILSLILSSEHLQAAVSIVEIDECLGPIVESSASTTQRDIRGASLIREIRSSYRDGLMGRGISREAAEARVRELQIEFD